ncbi:MAG TPA: TRAP transporter substrate-binding protein DctP, partial [Roseovarius sp.]|nr:TRAP transporter substrate-binding protein DctP [Roseovarius sp.]
MKVSKALSGISRRDLFRLTGQFGLSSVVMGAGALTGAVSLPSLARAAESTYDKRFAKEPKHTLKLGAAGFNARNLLIERAGVLEFAR